MVPWQARGFASAIGLGKNCPEFDFGLGKPVQSVEQFLSEIDVVFAKGGDIERNKLIVLMHDEMFQDHFDGETKLTALISGLKQRGYAFGEISAYAGAELAKDGPKASGKPE